MNESTMDFMVLIRAQDKERLALADEALRIMKERGWWAELVREGSKKWVVCSQNDLIFDYDKIRLFDCPFQALVEADRWMKEKEVDNEIAMAKDRLPSTKGQ